MKEKDSPSVFIATPTRTGQYCEGYVYGLMDVLLNEKNVSWGPMRGCSNIVAGRDTLAAYFMTTKHDVLLWIDSDTVFTRENYHEMIGAILQGDKVGCALQGKKLPKAFESPNDNLTANGFYNREGKVYCIQSGFGFFWVTRKAFQEVLRCETERDDLQRTPKIEVDLAGTMVSSYAYHAPLMKGGKMLSEDLSFCERLLYASIKIRVMATAVGHDGSAIFPGGDFAALKNTIFDARKTTTNDRKKQ
jgi:hypothetical protein